MNYSFSRALTLFLITFGVIVSFGLGFTIGKDQAKILPIEGVTNLEIGKPGLIDFSLFWDAWGQIQESYVNGESLDFASMVQGAISGMVDSLGDPYTVFMSAEDTDKFLDDISGYFEGVGMEIGIRKGQLQVVAPLEGTPAQKAGLRPGDRILAVDEESTRGMTIDEAVSRIRGERGTTVVLSIFRDSWDEAKDIPIKRAVIEIPSLAWELKEGNIAYIQLFQFSGKASYDFQQMVSEILASGAERIILDLRNNPGGFLEVSQDIAGWFIERGETVVIEDFGEEDSELIYKAQGSSRLGSYPMVVLINQGSASASEILAGALRDVNGVQLIGMKSFGKGSVQELMRLRDDSSLKITVAKWLTPNRTVINEMGLEPDVEVDISDEDFDEERDPQLERAIEIVSGL
ncbi:MAG: S41 family peptidase [Patescibacteria group bacterium]|nr:S41 family peptidase [Patescibacteria group bacterium]